LANLKKGGREKRALPRELKKGGEKRPLPEPAKRKKLHEKKNEFLQSCREKRGDGDMQE